MIKDKKRKSAIFQMDPFNKLNLDSDTSISLIKEAKRQGIDVWISYPSALSYETNKAYTIAYKVSREGLKVCSPQKKDLDKFDFFFIRQDPPFDLNYLTNCYLLEMHKKFNKRPFFVNDPGSIKNFTEKIFPLYFNDLMPKNCITQSKEVFLRMLKKHRKLVLKTLFNKGGEGVVKVQITKQKEALTIFEDLKKKYSVPVVVQEFLDDVVYGDKRVILIDGKPEGSVNRIPKKGEFKANLHLGGKAEKTTLTKKEEKICSTIKKTLRQEKLFFVGIDLINEKLTEINVTSPTGIVQIFDLSGINIAKKLWKKLLNKVS